MKEKIKDTENKDIAKVTEAEEFSKKFNIKYENKNDLEDSKSSNKKNRNDLEPKVNTQEMEDKSEKILEKIDQVDQKINEKINQLNNLFINKIQSIDFERETADKLHKELQEYKNDMYFQLVKPFIMDIISIREDMKRNLKNFNEKTEDKKIEFLQSYVEQLKIILENNDIEVYNTDIVENENFNPKKQRVMKKIETSDESLHGKIYNFLTDGYAYKEKVISPERVEVYAYKKNEEVEGE
jgi:grpE